jgi:hypothetical protein
MISLSKRLEKEPKKKKKEICGDCKGMMGESRCEIFSRVEDLLGEENVWFS